MYYSYISCALSHQSWLTLCAGVGFFLFVSLVLVVVLIVAKRFMVQSGDVVITVNGDRKIKAEAGKALLSTMADSNVFLPSACGGKVAASVVCR